MPAIKNFLNKVKVIIEISLGVRRVLSNDEPQAMAGPLETGLLVVQLLLTCSANLTRKTAVDILCGPAPYQEI
jgi:hypothetical protein